MSVCCLIKKYPVSTIFIKLLRGEMGIKYGIKYSVSNFLSNAILCKFYGSIAASSQEKSSRFGKIF